MTRKTNPRRGSSLDDFLSDEGVLEEANARAAKKALAWRFAEAMKAQKVSHSALARRMKTSRAQLNRVLDPENHSVTLKTLACAAANLGLELRIEVAEARRRR